MSWFTPLAEGAAKMGASVKQAAGNVAASVKASAQQVAATVKSAFDKTAASAGKTVDAAKQDLANAYDQAKAAGSNAAKNVEDATASAKQCFAPKPPEPVMVCAAPPGTPPPRNDQPPCCVTGMTVKCAHTARQFTLSVPGTKQRDNRHVIQVLGTAQDPDELLITLKGGPCVQGKPGASGTGGLVPDRYDATVWPSVSATGEKVSVRAASPFKVKAYGPDANSFLSLLLFIQAMVDRRSVVRSTELAVRACNGGQDYDVLVEVFPPLRGSAFFRVGRSRNYSFTRGEEKVEIGDGWSLSFSPIQLYCGKTKLDFFNVGHSGSWDDSSNRQSLFTRVRGVLGGLLNFVDYVGDGRVTYTPPNLQVTIDIAATEQLGDWQVKPTGSISVGFNPLLEASITFDILEQLIRIIGSGSSVVSGPAGPIVAEILIKARRKVAGKAPVEVKLDLIVTGNISGGLKWIMPDGVQGQIDSSVAVDLKGSVKAEFRKFLIGVGATGEIGAKSKVGARLAAARRDAVVGFNGLLYFDGLKIYYVVDFDVGIGVKDEPPQSKPSRESSGTELKTKIGDSGSTWTLIEAASWPATESFVDLSDDFF